MRAAPLKPDCLICQAPEPTRVAINAAIWPGDGILRSVTYRADATEVARTSGVPSLANLDRKTVSRHADHIEESWREIKPGAKWRDGEVPLQTDFRGVMDSNVRVGAQATALIGRLLDEHGDTMVVMQPKFVLDVAHKLGVGAAGAREAARLKERGQNIDIAAIFGVSAGFVRPPASTEEVEGDLVELRDEWEAERRLLAERALA